MLKKRQIKNNTKALGTGVDNGWYFCELFDRNMQEHSSANMIEAVKYEL